MDSQDLAILGALARSARDAYADVGERVGLTANAVKARVHRMEAEGILQGFATLPSPSLLGLAEGLLLFTGVDDLDEREEEILRGLAEVPGVRCTDASVDHALYVWVLHRDDEDWERIERAAVSLVGKPPHAAVRGDPASAPPRDLSAADWKVVHALRHDARAHAKELAPRAGLSFKPLKRRLDALLRAGDVRIHPIVSPADAPGGSLFRVVCFLAPGAAPPAVPGALVEREAPGIVSVLALRPTIREARSLARELRRTPGVERALLQLATRRASLGWLDDAIARRLVPAPRAPPVAPAPLLRRR